MAFRTVTVGTTLTEILPFNPKRTAYTIKNYVGGTVFVSNDQTNIVAQGFPLAVGDFISMILAWGDEPADQLYAQMSAGSTDLRIEESFGDRINPSLRTR